MAGLEFATVLAPSDPYDNAVLIIGQLKHLARVRFEDVQCKFGGRVDNEVRSKVVKRKDSTSTKNLCE